MGFEPLTFSFCGKTSILEGHIFKARNKSGYHDPIGGGGKKDSATGSSRHECRTPCQ